jgi:exosortase/archaeosortase family protein
VLAHCRAFVEKVSVGKQEPAANGQQHSRLSWDAICVIGEALLSGPTEQIRLRDVAVYVFIMTILSAGLYYLPNYFILEKITADHSAVLLNWIGIPAISFVKDGRAFVNEFEIERMCTGVQVTAIFAGLLIPFPKVAWRRKAAAIASVAIFIYFANIGRIVLEVWLLYNGILPWYLAHYPTGLILGIFSVAFLVIVLDHFIPEIGDYAMKATEVVLPRRSTAASPS